MADANLLEVLNKESRLDNMVIYGNIRCAIETPSFLSSSTRLLDGFYALVDVLALHCSGVDYFSKYSSYQDSKHIYFSKGSLIIVCNDKNLIGKNVRVYGKNLNGCTIKKQRTRHERDGIVAFVWSRMNDNWCISPNKIMLLGDSDVKGTVLQDYIVNLVTESSFSHPESVESLMEYCGVLDAKPIELNKVSGSLDYIEGEINLSSIPLNLVNRLEAKSVSEVSSAVEEDIEVLQGKSIDFAKGLVSSINSKEDSLRIAYSIVDGFVDNIADRFNLYLRGDIKAKGRDFVLDLLDNVATIKFASTEKENEEVIEENRDSITKMVLQEVEKLRTAVALDSSVLKPENLKIPVLQNIYKYATMVIGCVTGIGITNLVDNYNSASKYNDLSLESWFWCLVNNPYLCGLMGSGLNIWDCDRLYIALVKGFEDDDYDEDDEDSEDSDCYKYRAYLMILEAIKKASSRSTLITKRSLSDIESIYPSQGLGYYKNSGIRFKPENEVATSYVVGKTLKDNLGKTFVNSNIVLKELNNIGLIEEINNNSYILASDLRKEYVIYSKLIRMGRTRTGITDDKIEEAIETFEGLKGFNLEALQKEGIKLIKYKAGVLSGCAGSGKTTTSDCMVLGIETNLPRVDLKFGAPTGKAARRLAEVVGGDVKTIHSMFGLSLTSEPYIYIHEAFFRKNKEGGSTAYFLDEMAMCNMNLMYSIVSRLNTGDLVYFLGDIKQLAPIGKGSPFRALMQFLPCVELGVSKRAAEGSKINYNCGLINFVSDDKVAELQPGDDFEIKSCPDAEIPLEVVNTFREYLKDYKEDDIQVVTGYNSEKYPWSTINLNPSLQNILRVPEESLYTYNNQKFMKNDRVIHVKRNAYDMPRYRRLGNNMYEEVVTSGVVNGELGKIVGLERSDMCIITRFDDIEAPENESEEMKKLRKQREDSNVEIRDDSQVHDESTYFVVVQVYDVDLKEDVYVLYYATHKEDLTFNLVGGDLRYLELAYALTTHKMQGSQSPAIIIPLGSRGSAEFMNRNMINTMISRASEKVCMIGSVKGKDSALTNGRRITSSDEGKDVLSILAE